MIVEQHAPAPHDTELQPPSTPRVISIDPETDAAPDSGSWGSPAFLRSAWSSYGRTLDSAFDPFANDDGFVPGKGRKRPRYSLRREEWRIVDEPDSPREREGTVDWEKAFEDEMNIEQDLETTADIQLDKDVAMPNVSAADNQVNNEDPFQDDSSVFVKPSLEYAGSIFGKGGPQSHNASELLFESAMQDPQRAAVHLSTDTPQLRPIPSPGLPIPSPLISNQYNTQGYLSPFHVVQQPQDVQSISMATDIVTTVQTQSSLAHIRPNSQLSATTALTRQADTTPSDEPSTSSPRPLDHDDFHLASPGETPPAESGGAIPTDSMGIFNSPTFMNHPEFNEPDIEMEDADENHMIPAAESLDHQSESIENNEEEEDADEEEDEGQRKEEEHREVVAGADDEEPGVEAVESKNRQTKYAYYGSLVDARGAIDVENVRDELEEHASEEVDSQELSREMSLAVENVCYPHSRSDNENGSDAAEDEALYAEEDAVDSISQDDYDEDEDEEDSGDEDFETEPLQRVQPTQPEVIVLDSDSEDELASDQPNATLLQSMRQEPSYHRESFVGSGVADFAAEENEETWSVVGEKPDYEAVEGDDQSEDYDRMHDSDIDDDSSVDILAGGLDAEEYSSRDNSIEQEQDDGQVEDAEAEARPLENQVFVGDIHAEAHTESVIDLDSGEDEETTTQDDGKFPEMSEHFPRDQPREGWERASVLYSLDGANDRDLAHSPSHEEDREELRQEEEDEEDEGHRQLPERLRRYSGSENHAVNGPLFDSLESVPTKHAEPQLPTPDPTQEADSGQPSALIEKTEISPTPDSRASPLGLNITLQPALDEELVPSAHLADEVMSDNLPTHEDRNGFNDAGVAVPSAGDVRANEQPEEVVARRKLPGIPTVLITKPTLPDRHALGLRSKLSYFAPLATLIDHYNALVDTISIVHESTPIAKATSGSKDYFLAIHLTDPSMAGTTLQAQVFRRYKSALPSLAEGNAILLRNFKVRSYDHSIMLVSIESSSWAVFEGLTPEAQMNGPPVEYGSEERAYASGLRRWFSEIGADMVADNQLQASIEMDRMNREPSPSDLAISESGSLDSISCADSVQSSRGLRRSRKSHRRVTIHELRDGTRYTEVGSPSSKESIHELRDGTVYANL